MEDLRLWLTTAYQTGRSMVEPPLLAERSEDAASDGTLTDEHRYGRAGPRHDYLHSQLAPGLHDLAPASNTSLRE